MPTKRHKPEEIASKLGQVGGLVGHGMARTDAIREVSITKQTHTRRRKPQAARTGTDQLKALKRLDRLDPALSDRAPPASSGCGTPSPTAPS